MFYFSLGTIAPLPILGRRTAKKDGFDDSRVKFVSVVRVNMNKAGASESLDGRLFTVLRCGYVLVRSEGQWGVEI